MCRSAWPDPLQLSPRSSRSIQRQPAFDVVTRLVDPAVQHTHPPLFYVLMHAWLSMVGTTAERAGLTLRAVAAVFGVLAVVLIFGLARSAFREARRTHRCGTRRGLAARW